MKPKHSRPIVAGAMFALLVGAILLGGSWRGGVSGLDGLVVYCAHDSVYSEQILRDFERQTGIPVKIRFDTEATKSLGLVNLLIQEKSHPRCDVFWNNQVLGTLELLDHDLVLPYKGSGYERIPTRFKDPDGYWTGFAARMRVYIVNTEKVPDADKAAELMASDDLSRATIAKPLYGTTRTHYTILWQRWGGEGLNKWHRDVQERGLRISTGNATVKNLVAEGTCDFGWTDTDDFFVAKDQGKPVAMGPVRLEDGATICIPNCVVIIKGTSRLAEAQQLIDFLLSKQTELALAASRARQIPLGPVAADELSAEVRQLKSWAVDACELPLTGEARQECLSWLKSEYLR